MRRCGWRSCCAVLMVVAMTVAAKADPIPERLGASLDALIAADRVVQTVPGVAVCLVGRDGVIFRHFSGFADQGRARAVGFETQFRWASMSKIFTAIALLRLVDGGRVRLDDPIRQYLPWFRFADDPAPAVTVGQTLLHLGGLPREVPGSSWQDQVMPDVADLMRDLPRARTVLPPETQWKYSNLGYALLGMVVEAAAGVPYETAVAEGIGKPLGIASLVPRMDAADLAVGYGGNGAGSRAPRPFLAMGPMMAAAGLAGRCDDLAHLVQFLLTGQPAGILSAASLRSLLQPHHVLPDFSYAEGYGLNFRQVGGRLRIGHSGRALGYAGRFELDPVGGLGVVVLTNADENGPAALAGRILDAALTALPPPPAIVPTADPAWGRWVGTYRDQGQEIAIAVLAGRLTWMNAKDPAAATVKISLSPVPGTDDQFTFDQGALVGEVLSFERDPTSGAVTGMRAADGSRARRAVP